MSALTGIRSRKLLGVGRVGMDLSPENRAPTEHATEMMTASVRTTAANTPAVSLTSIKPLYTT